MRPTESKRKKREREKGKESTEIVLGGYTITKSLSDGCF